jgi:CheY-like chemotaxis protein
MTVLIIEDDEDDIRDVKKLLERSGFFDVRCYQDYTAVGPAGAGGKLPTALEEVDLCILDIYMQAEEDGDAATPEPYSTSDFRGFVEMFRGRVPFIVFTAMRPEYTMKIRRTRFATETVARFVYRHGGIGIIHKTRDVDPNKHPNKFECENQLLERVLTYYWSAYRSGAV